MQKVIDHNDYSAVKALFTNIETDRPVWSFDIDLTLIMPEDEPYCEGVIPISRLIELQDKYIVGTCSDREPLNQWVSMTTLGFTPDFCIPKELLATASSSLNVPIIHVGDDEIRDKEIAEKADCMFMWPAEFLRA